MGVYIKGMEMPKNCFDCMFHWHGDGTTYCLAQSKMHDLHHIKWECKGYEEQMKYREPTCPLVPVQTHGRLIEKNAVFKLIQSMPSVDKLLPVEFMEALYNLPTIIPASEEE